MLSLYLHLSSFNIYVLITTVIVFNYGLKCVTNLDISYILYSAHILFDYKLVLGYSCIWESKRSLVFIRYSNFQVGYGVVCILVAVVVVVVMVEHGWKL